MVEATAKGALEIPLSMDMSLDDIEDLPGFVVFPSGAYQVSLEEGLVKKDINEHPAMECAMKLVETLEMTEPLKENEVAPAVGDVCTISFMLDNKFGVGKFKEFLTPIGTRLGLKNIGEIAAQTKGLQLMVVIKRTYDKDKDRHYANVKKVEVL